MSTLRIPVSTSDHARGPATAPVTLVEYGDFECPHCGKAYFELKEVLERFGDSLRFVYRHFPLKEIHRVAEPAAETAEFAAERGRFWEMHDAIFENQHRLDEPLLYTLAESQGLSPMALRDVIAIGTYRARVAADFIGGVRSGASSTPTFYINGQKHEGGRTAAALIEAIEAARERPPSPSRVLERTRR
jgi:protein-disulfide isomerase